MDQTGNLCMAHQQYSFSYGQEEAESSDKGEQWELAVSLQSLFVCKSEVTCLSLSWIGAKLNDNLLPAFTHRLYTSLTIKRAHLELKCRVNLPLVFFAVGILSMKQYINKRKIAGHIYIPVFLSRKWLYHMIAFPFSGLTTRLLLWQFWARLHFQPSPFSQACQKSNRQLSTVDDGWNFQTLALRQD